MRKALRALCLTTSVLAATAASTAAYGQAADGSELVEQDAAAAPGNDIVVTGSRTVRDGSDQPTPVTVISTQELIKTAPASIADGLNQLPAFQNSINANQQQFTQGNRQRTGNYLNLRSLGTQRVLVLLDGQRLPQTGTNGGVDATLAPQLLTERVDVVTGGASAVYGSDAVSGVVNFVINKRFNGLTAQAQRGLSDRADNGSYRLGVAGGVALFDDRLHLIASAERYHSDGMEKTDLPIIGRSFQSVGLGTAADPIRVVDDVRFGVVSDTGYIRNGPLAGRMFDPTGTLIVPFNTGTPSGVPGSQRGGDGALIGQLCCTITPSQTSNQVFGRATYELTDDIEIFALAGYNWSRNADRPLPIIDTAMPIFRDNAYLTPAMVTALGTTPSFTIGKVFNNRRANQITQYSSSLNIQTGIQGKLGDFSWNVGYVHGRTKFRTVNIDRLNTHYYAAVDAVFDPGGNIVCRVTLTNPGLYPGCVPLNPFGIGNESDEAYEYLLDESVYRAINKLDIVQASIGGDLFEGWAGPITVAVGGEYRKQQLNQTSNSDPTVPTDFTGLRGVPANTLKYGFLAIGPAKGSYTVKEVFGEINVPVLRDSAVGSLELNGAVRYTDYSTSGSVTTWKGGAVFDPVDGVRFRATYSRDIRAPTLFELFAGQTSTVVTFTDRLTGVQASARQIGGGNPNLRPEIAKTLTAGLVLKPNFLPGFSLSADYFNIKISDAIATPYSAFQLIDLCAASNYTSPLCNQIVRPLGPSNPDPENTPQQILTNLQNVSVTKLSGIDFEANYTMPVGASGRLTFRAAATRQLTFKQQNAPGQPIQNFVGTADYNDVQFPLPLPKWRGTFNIGYEDDNFAINVQERLIGGFDRSHVLVYAENRVPAVLYTDLNLTFKVKAGDTKFDLFATVNNLFDKDYPIVPVTRTAGLTVPTMRNTYDIVGRYFTVGARVKL